MEWKTCQRAPDYSVSSTGLVRNNNTNKIMTGTLNEDGYRVVSVAGKNVRVHRLVAEEFLSKPLNIKHLVVNHKNKVRSDNNVSNLEWCSQSENVAHGSASKREIAVTVNNITTVYESTSEAAVKLQVKRSSITNCLTNRSTYIRIGDKKATVKYVNDTKTTKRPSTVTMTDSIGWFPIEGCAPYEINYNGVVRRSTGKPNEYYIMSTSLRSGYPCLSLRIEGSKQAMRPLHIIVAKTFIPNDDESKTLVNHKNGNRLDYRVDNLEWVTPRENCVHAATVLGSKNHKPVIRVCTFTDQETRYISLKDACRQNGLVYNTMSMRLKRHGEHCDGKFIWKYGNLKYTNK